MSRSAAHRRQEFDAPKSVPKPVAETVAVRRRPHAQSLASTAIVVEQRPLIRELLTYALKQRAGFESSPQPRSTSTSKATAPTRRWSSSASRQLERRRDAANAAARRAGAAQTPIVVLSDSEDFQNVLSILQSGTRGYISTAMTLDVAIEALWLVQAGGQFLPATCIIGPPEARLPTHRQASSGALARNIYARGRLQVVKALCQGKANKIIAYELKMKESTVKVHVRNIMKKLKAKNRTEVAYITNQLSGGAQAK